MPFRIMKADNVAADVKKILHYMKYIIIIKYTPLIFQPTI